MNWQDLPGARRSRLELLADDGRRGGRYLRATGTIGGQTRVSHLFEIEEEAAFLRVDQVGGEIVASIHPMPPVNR